MIISFPSENQSISGKSGPGNEEKTVPFTAEMMSEYITETTRKKGFRNGKVISGKYLYNLYSLRLTITTQKNRIVHTGCDERN